MKKSIVIILIASITYVQAFHIAVGRVGAIGMHDRRIMEDDDDYHYNEDRILDEIRSLFDEGEENKRFRRHYRKYGRRRDSLSHTRR